MKFESQNNQETPKEIERKFKVKKLPDNLSDFPSSEIRQGYLSVDGVDFRVRQMGDKYYKTIKTGSGMVRDESETEITKGEFDGYWTRTDDRVILKTRYNIDLGGGNIAELDVYKGDLAGLVVVEVEFASEDSAKEFIAPNWFGEDVTEDSAYNNSTLATEGYPELDSIKPSFELQEGVDYLIKEVEKKLSVATGPVVVLVAGGSASGKTSAVAAQVHKAFSSDSIVMSLDDYYRGNAFKNSMALKGIIYNNDQPEMLNLDLFSDHLKILKENTPITKPVFSFVVAEKVGEVVVQPKKVIIVEGLFALNDKLVANGDIKVFVETGIHGRLLRRVIRDTVERGDNPNSVLSEFSKIVEPMHKAHVESTKKNADFIIKNEYDANREAKGEKEIQIKFHGTLDEEKLLKLGAEKQSNVYQIDTYYSPADRDLKMTGELFRIREENGHYYVSYKGKKDTGDFKIRPKIDFEMDSETRDAFVKIYTKAVTTIKKERKLYYLSGISLSLDRVTKIDTGTEKSLGDFIEIRAIDADTGENDITRIAELLNLKVAEGDKRSYSEM